MVPRFARIAAGVVVAGLLTVTMTAAAPAAAAAPVHTAVKTDLVDDLAAREAGKLESYRVMVNAEQLTAAGGTTERNAWSAQKGAMAAKDAARYNVRSMVGLEKGFASVDLIRPFPAGSPLVNGWAGKVKMPRYSGLGLKAGAGPLTAALIGFDLRGTMSDGVLKLAGLGTKDDLVCEQNAGGFVNWLTDVDCDLWAANSGWVSNADAKAGFTLGPSCNDAGSCLQYLGVQFWDKSASHNYGWCMKYDKTPTDTAPAPLLYGTPSGGVLTLLAAGVDPYPGTGTAQTFNAPFCDGIGANGVFKSNNSTKSETTPAPVIAYLIIRNTDGTQKQINPVETSGDPLRYRVCEQTGSDGKLYSASTAGYHDSDVSQNGFPAIVCGQMPLGVYGTHLKIVERSAGMPDKILDEQDADATPETDALLGAPAATYCQTNICQLDLAIKSSGVSCFSSNDTCDGWWQKDNHGDAEYQCSYGGHAIAVGECALYAQVFNTQKRLAGNPYADPVTGEDPGTMTGPSVDGEMMAGVPRASFQGRDCFGAGYGSLNPLQWVLRPLQCFGEWAFVPRTSTVIATGESIRGAWDGTPPVTLANAVTSWNVAPSMSGCSLPVDVPMPALFGGGSIHLDLADACEGGPLASTAAISRLVLNLVVLVGAGFLVTRYVSAQVGYTGL